MNCKECGGSGTKWVVDRVVQGQDYGPQEEGYNIKCSRCNGKGILLTTKIYEAHSGEEGGPGFNGSLGFFNNKEDAKAAAKGRGGWGHGDGTVEEHVIYNSFADYEQNRPEAIRKRALAKLTKEEREALYLRED